MNRLYRSQRDKKVFGLCGGIAESFNVDVTLLRLIVVITTVFSGGTVGFVYIVASLVVPKEPGYEGFDTTYKSTYDANRSHTSHTSHASHASHTNGTHTSRYWHEQQKAPQPPKEDNIDHMMEDLEKKALWKEIEELKRKLQKYEDEKKGE